MTWKVRHDHGGLITPLLSTSNLAPTVKTHFERQCSHHWSLPHTYHSNNTESKFSSGVAGLSDLASLQVLCQKIELFFFYILNIHIFFYLWPLWQRSLYLITRGQLNSQLSPLHCLVFMSIQKPDDVSYVVEQGFLHRGPLDVNSEAATGKGSDMCVCGWDTGRESTKRSASFNRYLGESRAWHRGLHHTGRRVCTETERQVWKGQAGTSH